MQQREAFTTFMFVFVANLLTRTTLLYYNKTNVIVLHIEYHLQNFLFPCMAYYSSFLFLFKNKFVVLINLLEGSYRERINNSTRNDSLFFIIYFLGQQMKSFCCRFRKFRFSREFGYCLSHYIIYLKSQTRLFIISRCFISLLIQFLNEEYCRNCISI